MPVTVVDLMQGAPWDITIAQGRNFSESIRYGYKDESGLFVPVPLQGWDGRGMVRLSEDPDSDLLLTFDVDVNQATDTSDPDCGRITWSAGYAATDLMDRPGKYDIEIYTNDFKFSPVFGSAYLRRKVTTDA